MQPELAAARRILAVRMDNIGDVVMLGPALRALREAAPAAHITLLCSPAGAQGAALLGPWVDELLVERAVWQDASHTMPLDPGRELALIGRVRAGRFDAALIFTSFSQSPFPPAYTCYVAGIPFRAAQVADFGGSVLSRAVEPLPASEHQVERNLHLLEALGVPVASRDLSAHVPADAARSARSLLAAAGVREDDAYVVIAPAASCHARTYEAERFAAAGRMLAARDRRVLLVAAERDGEVCTALAAAIPGAVSLAGRTSVPELAAVIQGADLLVGSHSGPMHIADAVRTPMVILFSGTDLESQWQPRGAPAVLLRRPTPCAPCYAFECTRDLACLAFSPEEVVSAAEPLLAAGRERAVAS